MLALISGLIAAGLYGNIGIKVLYNNVLADLFSAPPLNTRGGRLIWAILVPIWWSIAYIIAAAIPDYFGFVSVISAGILLHFTYTFPPLLALAYDIKLQSVRALAGGAEEAFDPQTGVTRRAWHGVSRYVRGFLSGGVLQVTLNILHVLYALGALVMSGLGLYSAIEGK